MKTKVIVQPKYIGDVIFCMAIAQKFMNDGYKVIWPVAETYLSKNKVQKYFPGIEFVPLVGKTKNPELSALPMKSGCIEYIDLEGTDRYKKHMGMKYEKLGLDVNLWKTIKIKRDYAAENRLLDDLGLNDGEKFNLINEYYSNKKSGHMNPQIDNGYRNIYMRNIEGYSLLDWMGVLERAETIHTVHTSIQYLIEVLESVTVNVHIYPRVEIYEPHSYYDYLFDKKYIYHNHPQNLSYLIRYRIRIMKRALRRIFRSVFAIG